MEDTYVGLEALIARRGALDSALEFVVSANDRVGEAHVRLALAEVQLAQIGRPRPSSSGGRPETVQLDLGGRWTSRWPHDRRHLLTCGDG